MLVDIHFNNNKYKFFKKGEIKMALYVIARLLDEKGRSLAYKIYSDQTKKSMLIHRRDIINEIYSKNRAIVGIDILVQNIGEKCSVQIKEQRNLFKTAKTDAVDCKGNLITNNPKYVVIGVYGFGINREFKCVDGNAVEYKIPYERFIELLHENRIVGAALHNGAIHIYKDCNKQLYEKI